MEELFFTFYGLTLYIVGDKIREKSLLVQKEGVDIITTIFCINKIRFHYILIKKLNKK